MTTTLAPGQLPIVCCGCQQKAQHYGGGRCLPCWREWKGFTVQAAVAASVACRHCGEVPATRPRQLCWGCHGDATIRSQYKYAPRSPKLNRPLCQHCHENPVNRPRGLCWNCYYMPGVKDRYPSTSKFARAGVGNGNRNAPLPDASTMALPGSEEKIAVLESRARLKQQLHHPQDARPAGGWYMEGQP